MMWLSSSEVPSSSPSVRTRHSGLYGRRLSGSPNFDHGLCGNGRSYSRRAMPTRRTNGESYWPMRIMELSCCCELVLLAGAILAVAQQLAPLLGAVRRGLGGREELANQREEAR